MTTGPSPFDKPLTQDSEQSLITLLQKISLTVNQSEEIDTAFSAVLALVCRFMHWPLGHVYILSKAAKRFVSSRVWYAADKDAFASFRTLSETLTFAQGESVVGQVWASGEPLFIADVRQDPTFARQLPVREGGICAYFAFPVMIDGSVRAILEFFSPESAVPDPKVASIINHVSALLGLAMQRQQTVTRLRQSEALLAEAQRTAHVGHWEWDIVEDRVTWSSELYRIFGLTPDNFTATYEGFLARTHPDDRDYVQKKVMEAYQSGRPFDYFHRVVRPDNSERVLHARGRPVYDQAGSIIKLYGTVQDMTEQKEAELQLAQTVRHLSAMMEIGQAVTAILDLTELYDQVLTLVRPLLGADVLLLFLQKMGMLEVVALDQKNDTDSRGLTASLVSGIAGEVWRSRRSLLLQEDEWPQRLLPDHNRFTGFQPRSLIAVPILLHEETLGVLEAAHPDTNAFDEADLRLLETAAAWTAIAIGNARKYKKLERRLSERDAISAVSDALRETLKLDELLQLIVNEVHKIVPSADWATIHLLSSKANQLELAASAGLEVDSDAYVISMGEGIAGRVMAEGRTLNVADVQTDPRRLPIDLSIDARALLVAPVESRHRRLGTISVQCAMPSTFTPDDERLLKTLGVQAGIAIENAQLYAAQEKARKRAERQRERMRQMAQRVVEAQENERARIARELHDESGQSLTSLKISLNMIYSLLPDDLADIKENLQQLLSLTDKTMTNLRLLSHNLRPPGLDAYGLDAALEGLSQDYKTHTSLDVSYSGVELPDLAPLSALSLYRFAQEALTNVAKHAQAAKVLLTLAQDADTLTLVVEDNGSGFIPPDLEEAIPSRGAGLVGMMERLEMVGGRLIINSTIGEGSRLTAVVPYTRMEG